MDHRKDVEEKRNRPKTKIIYEKSRTSLLERSDSRIFDKTYSVNRTVGLCQINQKTSSTCTYYCPNTGQLKKEQSVETNVCHLRNSYKNKREYEMQKFRRFSNNWNTSMDKMCLLKKTTTPILQTEMRNSNNIGDPRNRKGKVFETQRMHCHEGKQLEKKITKLLIDVVQYPLGTKGRCGPVKSQGDLPNNEDESCNLSTYSKNTLTKYLNVSYSNFFMRSHSDSCLFHNNHGVIFLNAKCHDGAKTKLLINGNKNLKNVSQISIKYRNNTKGLIDKDVCSENLSATTQCSSKILHKAPKVRYQKATYGHIKPEIMTCIHDKDNITKRKINLNTKKIQKAEDKNFLYPSKYKKRGDIKLDVNFVLNPTRNFNPKLNMSEEIELMEMGHYVSLRGYRLNDIKNDRYLERKSQNLEAPNNSFAYDVHNVKDRNKKSKGIHEDIAENHDMSTAISPESILIQSNKDRRCSRKDDSCVQNERESKTFTECGNKNIPSRGSAIRSNIEVHPDDIKVSVKSSNDKFAKAPKKMNPNITGFKLKFFSNEKRKIKNDTIGHKFYVDGSNSDHLFTSEMFTSSKDVPSTSYPKYSQLCCMGNDAKVKEKYEDIMYNVKNRMFAETETPLHEKIHRQGKRDVTVNACLLPSFRVRGSATTVVLGSEEKIELEEQSSGHPKASIRSVVYCFILFVPITLFLCVYFYLISSEYYESEKTKAHESMKSKNFTSFLMNVAGLGS